MNTILFIAIIILISELIYLIICRQFTKRELDDDGAWAGYKILSIIWGAGVGMIVYAAMKDPLAFGKVCLYAGLIIGGVILYFYLNYKLGLAIAKKK